MILQKAKEATSLLDFVQLMTINPGFQGQQFKPEILQKIRKLRIQHPDLDIQVDGGVDPKVAKLVVKAGANLLVSGSFVFGDGNIKETIKKSLNMPHIPHLHEKRIEKLEEIAREFLWDLK